MACFICDIGSELAITRTCTSTSCVVSTASHKVRRRWTNAIITDQVSELQAEKHKKSSHSLYIIILQVYKVQVYTSRQRLSLMIHLIDDENGSSSFLRSQCIPSVLNFLLQSVDDDSGICRRWWRWLRKGCSSITIGLWGENTRVSTLDAWRRPSWWHGLSTLWLSSVRSLLQHLIQWPTLRYDDDFATRETPRNCCCEIIEQQHEETSNNK